MSDNGNQTQINGLLSPLLQKLRIKNAKPYFKGKVFLDVGCSLGEIIKHLPKDIDYTGIEGNSTYCENARKLHPDKNFINLYLDPVNVNKLQLKKPIDTVTMLAIVEHMDDPGGVLKGLRKYLADDGVIIISTPNKIGNSILNIGSKFGIFMNEMHEHKELFTKKRLFEIVAAAGYKVIAYHKFEFGLNHLLVIGKNED